MKVLKALGFIVIWFALFEVLWIFGGAYAFGRIPEQITLGYILWAGLSDFWVVITVFVLIGLLPVMVPGFILKGLKVTPILCGLYEVAHCVYLMLNSSGVAPFVLVIAGAVIGTVAAVFNNAEKKPQNAE